MPLREQAFSGRVERDAHRSALAGVQRDACGPHYHDLLPELLPCGTAISLWPRKISVTVSLNTSLHFTPAGPAQLTRTIAVVPETLERVRPDQRRRRGGRTWRWKT